MSNAAQFAKANESYVQSFGPKGSLALPPARKVIIITCMDARIDPAASLGLKEGDAHIIRNAGGRVQDALRSIIISQQLLGTTEIVIFHHTDCGMLTFSDEVLRSKLKEGLKSDALNAVIDQFAFLAFPDLERSVKEDVAFLKASPLLIEESKKTVTGWVYDVKTGKVTQVV